MRSSSGSGVGIWVLVRAGLRRKRVMNAFMEIRCLGTFGFKRVVLDNEVEVREEKRSEDYRR
jgi:hypothetical protein